MNSSSKSVRPQILRRCKMVPESTQFCSYSHRVCMQMRLEGYDYCARHILEDKNSPFKQCQYVSSKTSKRCTSAALRSDKKEGYCADHGRRAAQLRFRAGRKRQPKETPELLLEELEHYTPKSSNSNGTDSKKPRTSESTSAKIIDYMSSSDSEAEVLTVEQTWRGDGDSDAESVDSEQEDPLKHASVYTAEEVALITRDKLIRLQSLYIDQFKRLQHVMKEKRRRYLHTVSKERELLGSIRYAKEDPKQRNKYDELVAMKRYHKRYGQEALLHRQSKERRIAVSEGINYKPPAHPKCIVSCMGGKCGARTVPLSKYCLQHMLSDPHQVLYTECKYADQCKRPVVTIADGKNCSYHTQPTHIDYRLPKKEEKDESKDEIDVVGGGDTKPEDPHQSLQLQLQLKQDQMKQDLSKQDLSKQDLSKQDLFKQDLFKQDLSQPGLIKQDPTKLIQIKPDPEQSTSRDTIRAQTPTALIKIPTTQAATNQLKPGLSAVQKSTVIAPLQNSEMPELILKGDTDVVEKPRTSPVLSGRIGSAGVPIDTNHDIEKPRQTGLLQIVTDQEATTPAKTPLPLDRMIPARRVSQEKSSGAPLPGPLCITSQRQSSQEKVPQSIASRRVSHDKTSGLPSPTTLTVSELSVKLSPNEVPQVVSDLLEMEQQLHEVKQSQLLKRPDIVMIPKDVLNRSSPVVEAPELVTVPCIPTIVQEKANSSKSRAEGSNPHLLTAFIATKDSRNVMRDGEKSEGAVGSKPGGSGDTPIAEPAQGDTDAKDKNVPMDTS